jgi:uncharacterized protein (TIRG00374 family)
MVRQIERLRHSQLAWRAAAAFGSLALAGLIVLALSGIGFAGIGRSLESVHPWWLVAALALNSLSMFLRAASWQAVLRAALPDVKLRSLVVVRATMIGVLVSALVPGRFGEPARAYLVARHAGDTARRFPLVLGTVFAQVLINALAVAILAAITIASLALIRGHATALIAAGSVPLAIVALVVAGPALLARARRSHHAHLSRIVRWLSGQIIQVRRGLRVFTNPGLGAGAIVAQLAAWAVQTLAAYAVLYALNLQGKAGLAAAAAVLLAVNLTALVPITPSNIGIFQAATIAVLAAYGVDADHALAYGILLQAIEITTAVVLGVPALLAERITLNDIRRHAATTPTPPPPSQLKTCAARASSGLPACTRLGERLQRELLVSMWGSTDRFAAVVVSPDAITPQCRIRPCSGDRADMHAASRPCVKGSFDGAFGVSSSRLRDHQQLQQPGLVGHDRRAARASDTLAGYELDAPAGLARRGLRTTAWGRNRPGAQAHQLSRSGRRDRCAVDARDVPCRLDALHRLRSLRRALDLGGRARPPTGYTLGPAADVDVWPCGAHRVPGEAASGCCGDAG